MKRIYSIATVTLSNANSLLRRGILPLRKAQGQNDQALVTLSSAKGLREVLCGKILHYAQNDRRGGYSLVEMAVVIAVLGVIGGGMLNVMAGKQEATALKEQDKQMKAIDEAIVYHVKLRGRLPCPARPSLTEADADFGREDCNGPGGGIVSLTHAFGGANEDVWIGMLPTRTLGLADRYLYDEWNSRIGYVVIKKLATSAAEFNVYTTAIDRGIIEITDAAGNPMTEQSVDGVVAYAFLSYGKDRKGGYNRTGTAIACAGANLDVTNCDNADNIFIDGEVNDSELPANYFYDKVRWKALAQLKDEVEMDENCTASIIVAGKTSSFAIDKNDNYYAWGLNDTEQFGDGSGTTSATPRLISGHFWSAFHGEGGNRNMCGIKSGKLYCWGSDVDGGVGDGGGVGGVQPTPIEVPGFTDWESVSADTNTACGVRTNGRAYCWGNNSNGQVGNGDQIDQISPIEISGATPDWDMVVTGAFTSCGIRAGAAYCWGSDANGQLGNGAPVGNVLTPGLVTNGWTDWTTLAKRSQTTCGIANGNRAYCWGVGNVGQMGDLGTTLNNPAPVEVDGAGSFTNWEKIAVGDDHACGIRGGRLFCWGNNNHGELGVNPTVAQSLMPVEVDGAHADWKEISVNADTTCGIRNDGKFYCWGLNDDNQLGNGAGDKLVPTEVPGLEACVQ